MLQWTRVSNGNYAFWGNATLGGRLSHLLEDRNVTQVLPLEPPAGWARQQDMVANYLSYFRGIVQVFSKERPLNCECCRGEGGRGAVLPGVAAWGRLSRGTGMAAGSPWQRAHPGFTAWKWDAEDEEAVSLHRHAAVAVL